MPSHATSVFEEGLMVPPIKLWDQGVRNEAALRIMTRNSRMPDSLAADLDAECSACLMGSRRLGELFERYGRETVEACFDAIIDNNTEVYRSEILSKIPDGTYVWEDYAEHDGVDEPRLHTQRITMTMDSSRDVPLVLDFAGTSPQAKGPINHCGDYADGNFLKKWLAPILRNLADTPERMAELDVNEGIVALIEMRFPPPGTLLTPVFPAPTNARTFVILRLLGVLAGVVAKAVDGRMPADQETIRYTGVYGDDFAGEPYLMREVLGGGSGGRYYADGEDTIHVVPDSRNLPTEFTESRFPFLVERLGLAPDSGGPGQFRGGLGYEKHIRMLRDAHFMSIADRSILACWGLKGGKAGQPFQVTVDPGGPAEREVDALADAEQVLAGELIRIRTTAVAAGATRSPGRSATSYATCAGARCRCAAHATTTASFWRTTTRPFPQRAVRRLWSTSRRRKRCATRSGRAAPATSRSSTGGRATRVCPAAGPSPTSTGSRPAGVTGQLEGYITTQTGHNPSTWPGKRRKLLQPAGPLDDANRDRVDTVRSRGDSPERSPSVIAPLPPTFAYHDSPQHTRGPTADGQAPWCSRAGRARRAGQCRLRDRCACFRCRTAGPFKPRARSRCVRHLFTVASRRVLHAQNAPVRVSDPERRLREPRVPRASHAVASSAPPAYRSAGARLPPQSTTTGLAACRSSVGFTGHPFGPVATDHTDCHDLTNDSRGHNYNSSSGPATGFTIAQATDPTMAANPHNYTIRGRGAQFTPPDLTKGTTYYFRVRVKNGSTVSAYSTQVSANEQPSSQQSR